MRYSAPSRYFLTTEPGTKSIPVDVRARQPHLEAAEEGVVAHPVGYQVFQPSDALDAGVVRRREAEVPSRFIFNSDASQLSGIPVS